MVEAEELLRVGERIWTLEKLFNLRAGFGRPDDTLPPRLLSEPVAEGPAAGHVVDLPPMLDEYYAARGWDAEGVPTPRKLEELGLSWVAEPSAPAPSSAPAPPPRRLPPPRRRRPRPASDSTRFSAGVLSGLGASSAKAATRPTPCSATAAAEVRPPSTFGYHGRSRPSPPASGGRQPGLIVADRDCLVLAIGGVVRTLMVL